MSDVAINQVIAQMRVMASAAQSERNDVANQVESGFASLLQDSIDAVNASMTEVMVAGQRASLEFQAMTEVRNKLLNAYQEIMSMQV